MLSPYFAVSVAPLTVPRGAGGTWGSGRPLDVGWLSLLTRISLITLRTLKNKCTFYLFIHEHKFENGNIATVQ